MAETSDIGRKVVWSISDESGPPMIWQARQLQEFGNWVVSRFQTGKQMDYYFTAASDGDALRAKDLPGGPAPGTEGFDSVEAKDIMATALEELVAQVNGKDNQLVIARTLPLWPEMPENAEDYEPGSSIVRVPDSLRDDLAELDPTHAEIANFAQELFGYEHEDAMNALHSIVQLARDGRRRDRSIYWWSEM